jgi:hypothetical protein
MGDAAGATAACLEALARSPHEPLAHSNLGNGYLRARQFDEVTRGVPAVAGRGPGLGDVDCGAGRITGPLTERQLRRPELELAIYRYVHVTNREAKPFIWSKTPDQILDRRFCRRTSASGH